MKHPAHSKCIATVLRQLGLSTTSYISRYKAYLWPSWFSCNQWFFKVGFM